MNPDSNNGAEALSPADWDRAHETVQAAFRVMADAVQRRWPALTSSGGRTSTKLLPLFSYWTFEPPEETGLEAIVVGIDFRTGVGRVTVLGDICTEESGRILYDQDCRREVSPLPAAVIAAAREVSALLAAQVDVLVEALARSKPASATGPLERA